jgi:hypothetical protein
MVCLHFEKTLKTGKRSSVWVSNERSTPRELNLSFFFKFLCLFTFCKHKQRFVYIKKTNNLKNGKGALIWVLNERSIPRE